MKNILVASDLSDRSASAVERGIQLAKASGARLTLVYAVDEALPIPAQVQAAAHQSLRAALPQDGLDTAQIETPIGDPAEVVGDALRRTDADLLIVGPHKRRAFLEWVQETTMERLVRTCRRPVLLVTSSGSAPYARVLAGVDLSATCAAGLRHLRKIAPDAETTVFHAHAHSFADEARRDYDTWHKVHNLPDTLPAPTFFDGTPADALHDLMAETNFDLLAIGAHTRSNTARILVGGFTAALIRQPPCDLLLSR